MLDPTPNIAPEVQLPEPASTGKRTLSSEELVAGLRAMGVEVEMMPMHDSEPGATADQAPAANPSVIVAKPTPVAKAEPKPAESTEPVQSKVLTLQQRILQQTLPYLEALHPHHPLAVVNGIDQEWVFQTADNQPPAAPAKRPRGLTKVGSLRQLAKTLDRMNQDGYAILRLLNNTQDSKGKHDEEHISSFTGLFCDLDTVKKGKKSPDWDNLPLKPTMVVHSGHGLQAYWMLVDSVLCNGNAEYRANRDAYKRQEAAINKALEPYGADDEAGRLTQCPRLPGYFNMKYPEPDGSYPLVQIVYTEPELRYTMAQLKEAFPWVENKKPRNMGDPLPKSRKPESEDVELIGHNVGPAQILAEAAVWLDREEASTAGPDGDAEGGTKTLQSMMRLVGGWQLSVETALAMALVHYNPRCVPSWTEADLKHKIDDAYQAIHNPKFDGPALGHLRRRFIGTRIGQPIEKGWAWRPEGLTKVVNIPEQPGKDGTPPTPAQTLYFPLIKTFYMDCRTRTSDGKSWGIHVHFAAADGRPGETVITAAMLHPDGNALAVELDECGLDAPGEPDDRKSLRNYFTRARKQITTFALQATAPGWVEDQPSVWLSPHGNAYGPATGPVFLPGKLLGPETSGTLEEYDREVASLAVGNPLVAFAMLDALTGPLLEPMNQYGSILNWIGDSSKGKSTTLDVAMSMIGNPEPRLTARGTMSGIEACATQHSGSFFILDEYGLMDPKDAGAVAFMFAAGISKIRMTKTIAARPNTPWRANLESSSNHTLADLMAKVGEKSSEAHEVRMLEVPVPPEGMFTTSHGFTYNNGMPDFKQFSDHLKATCRKYFGIPQQAFMREFTQDLANDREDIILSLNEMANSFSSKVLVPPPGADPATWTPASSDARATDRFALVYVVACLVEEYGLFKSWPKGYAEQVCETVWNLWWSKRPHEGSTNHRNQLKAVLDAFETYGESRFSNDFEGFDTLYGHSSKTIRWGVRQPVWVTVDDCTESGRKELIGYDYYIHDAGWAAIHKGEDGDAAARACVKEGLMAPDKDGRFKKSKKGHGRWYTFPHKNLQAYRDRVEGPGADEPEPVDPGVEAKIACLDGFDELADIPEI